MDMNAWVFLALVLAALAIGAPFAHVLEMPVRRGYDPALYVTVTHTLYRYFGSVGAVIEVGAVLAAVFWAAGLGRSRTSPIRTRLGGDGGRVPGDGARAVLAPRQPGESAGRDRDQWEFTHAVRAGLFLMGLCGLLVSAFAARGRAAPAPDERRRGGTTG